MAKKTEAPAPLSAIDAMHECIRQSQDDLRVAYWTQNQEFLRGNQFIHVDPVDKRAYIVKSGMFVPCLRDYLGAVPSAPIDPHLRTLADSVKARAITNELLPQVLPMTSEDEDRDTAEMTTGLLLALHEELDEDRLRRQVVLWMLPAGNGFIKDTWDKTAGDAVMKAGEAGDATGEQEIDDDGNPLFGGGIRSTVPPSHAMMIPEGVTQDEDLPWIGEKRVMTLGQIKETWGVEVPEENNIQDINSLRAATVETRAQTLKGHAIVYEVFFRPDKAYPQGRHIVVANETVLEDKPWDPGLTAKYPDEWHPYTHIAYIDNAGDYWAKTPVDYAVPLQMHVNKLLRRIEAATKTDAGVWISDKGAVLWDEVDLGSEDIPHIEREIPGSEVHWQELQPHIQQLMAQKQDAIQRLNDLFSNFPVSRGDTDPNATSGKQVDMLQQANREQSNPLLSALADGFEKHWRKVARLMDVHYQDGRRVRVIGKNKQALISTYQRGQIRSFNVRVANRAAFFMTPEGHKQEVLQLLKIGALDIDNPVTKLRLADVLGTGDSETFFDSYLAAVNLARWENELFKAGTLEETDPYIQQQIQAPLMQYEAMAQQREQLIGKVGPEIMNAPEGAEIPEVPPEPGPPPVIEPWRRARITDNHPFHIEEHSAFAQTVEFEKLCQQAPQLRKAVEYHINDHKAKLAMSMQPSLPPSLLGGGGASPPPRPGPNQAGPPIEGAA
jgi:hypothetical protein